MDKEVPIWEKYLLTIEEAGAYFHIGQGRLRAMVNENPSADWVLWCGSRALIKRKKFEAVVDRLSAV